MNVVLYDIMVCSNWNITHLVGRLSFSPFFRLVSFEVSPELFE